MESLLKNLRELCLINGVSGDESAIREFIISALGNVNCDIKTDNSGNLIVFKKGEIKPKNKVMLCAHMDEVGFIATGINADGFVSLSAVGGVSDSVAYGRQIRFRSGITGVIGGKPVHLSEENEKEKQPKSETLFADVGGSNKEETERLVALGDCACFVSEFAEFGDDFIKCKALDDRVGCAVLLDLLLSDMRYDLQVVFTAQEEVGARGGGVAAYTVQPDFALIVEATTACDIPGVEGEKQVCKLGCGTVIPFMDKGTVYDKQLYNSAFETARENNLKCQTKTQIAGANDGATIHKSAGGNRTICLAAPCRYLHSPSCVANKNDVRELRILTEKMAFKLAEF